MRDTTGLVTLSLKAGDFDSTAATEIISQTVPESQVSLSSVISDILSVAEPPLELRYDPEARELLACERGSDLIADSVAAGGTVKVQTITPVAGQEGKTLQWEEASADSGFDADIRAATKGVIDAVRPAMSIGSLIQRLVASIDETDVAVIFVDQFEAEVKVATASDMSALLQVLFVDLDPEPAHAVKVVFAEPIAEGGSELPFEGGAV
jgi:hypothetical protein